ncbi:MAG: L-threonylcarbamoyladenylate synthase [Polyangiaceae bacterium]
MSVIREVSPDHPSAEVIDEAVRLLEAGSLVAFPTETVYGLGACAFDENAVKQVFAAKGRPGTHPLIVHVPDVTTAKTLAKHWPEGATKVAESLWPGGITLVLERSHLVSDAITGGGDTVAIRCPAHPVALSLLRALGKPIAAPSANRHKHVSPTTAAHVAKSLGDAVSLILDGGPCAEGMESTVLDLTTEVPEILRPGAVSAEAIRRVLGDVAYEPRYELTGIRVSPGQDPLHYAPNAPVEVVTAELLGARFSELDRGKGRVVCIVREGTPLPDAARARSITLPADAPGFSRALYAAFYEAEALDPESILVESAPVGESWDAVRDRLVRASAER